MTDLQTGHQVLARRNPKPAAGYTQDKAIVLTAADSVALDSARLPSGHKVYVRRSPKPASGWVADPMISMAATDIVTIPALSTSPGPTPEPTPTGMRGFGKNVTGGGTRTPQLVSSATDFKAAAPKGDQVLSLQGDFEIGGQVQIGDNTTIIGNRKQLERCWLYGQMHNVLLREFGVFPTDTIGQPDDCDAITVKAGSSGIYLDRLTMGGSPDVTLVFEQSEDITVDRCLVAFPLFLSGHSEAVMPKGHALAINCRNHPAGGRRISFIESGVVLNEGRVWLDGWIEAEMVNMLFYGFTEVPHGNPVSANFIDPLYIRGPEPEKSKAQPSFEPRAWDYRPSSSSVGSASIPKQTNAVYIENPKAVGYSFQGLTNDTSVLRATPAFSGTPSRHLDEAALLDGMGCKGLAVTDRAIGFVKSRGGQYENGKGKPAPNFTY